MRFDGKTLLGWWAPIALGLVALSILSNPALAQEHGHGALQIFDAEGRANAPLWVRAWIIVMSVVFAAGLLFVRRRIEARWAVGGFLAVIVSVTVAQSVFGIAPYAGLLAIAHLVFWTPALVVLLQRRPFLKERSAFGIWAGLMTAVIIFSFVFDIRDAAIYLDHALGLGLMS